MVDTRKLTNLVIEESKEATLKLSKVNNKIDYAYYSGLKKVYEIIQNYILNLTTIKIFYQRIKKDRDLTLLEIDKYDEKDIYFRNSYFKGHLDGYEYLLFIVRTGQYK